MVTNPVPKPLPTALVNALASLRKRGRAAQADRIEGRHAAVSVIPASLVVVGQLSRGKSTLVNALIGDPDFAPTGDRETTAVSITFTPPTAELADGAVRLHFVGEDRLIERSDLASWVTIDGARAEDAIDEGLLSVEVGRASPGLSGVAVVDTPGAGGLSELHAKRAILAAERAAVLVAVTDADGRITRDAVDFLRSCLEFAHSVVVVVNKIDRNRTGWQRVIEDNRAAIAGDGFPDVQFVGVSAAFAVRALAGGGDEWMRLSRIPELRDVLARRFARADELPTIVALRQAAVELKAVVGELDGDVMAASGTAEGIGELEEHQARIIALSKQLPRFGPQISSQLTRMQVDLDLTASHTLREFDERWRAELSRKFGGVSKSQLPEFRARMMAELDVMGAEVHRRLVERSMEIVEDMFATAGVDLPSYLMGGAGWEGALPPPAETSTDRPVSGGARTVGFMLMGAGVARVAVMPLAGMGAGMAALMGPVGAILGLAGVGVGLIFGGRVQNKQQLLDNLSRATTELRERLRHALTLTVSAVRDGALLELRDAVDDELRRLNGQVAASRQAKRTSEAERQKRVGDLTAHLRAVRLVLSNVEQEISRLSVPGNKSPEPPL